MLPLFPNPLLSQATLRPVGDDTRYQCVGERNSPTSAMDVTDLTRRMWGDG